MTRKKRSKCIVISSRVGTEDNHTITTTCRIYHSPHSDPLGEVRISSWLVYMQNTISPASRWNYRSKGKQYHGKGKVYRTKADNRRSGLSPVTVLCKHECDMHDNPESLTTEFMMKLIEDFKREPTK